MAAPGDNPDSSEEDGPIGRFLRDGGGVVMAGTLVGAGFGGALCAGPTLSIPFVGPPLAVKAATVCGAMGAGIGAGLGRWLVNETKSESERKPVVNDMIAGTLGGALGAATPGLSAGANVLTRWAYGTAAGTVTAVATEAGVKGLTQGAPAGLRTLSDPDAWVGAFAVSAAASAGVQVGAGLKSLGRSLDPFEGMFFGQKGLTSDELAFAQEQYALQMKNSPARLPSEKLELLKNPDGSVVLNREGNPVIDIKTLYRQHLEAAPHVSSPVSLEPAKAAGAAASSASERRSPVGQLVDAYVDYLKQRYLSSPLMNPAPPSPLLRTRTERVAGETIEVVDSDAVLREINSTAEGQYWWAKAHSQLPRSIRQKVPLDPE